MQMFRSSTREPVKMQFNRSRLGFFLCFMMVLKAGFGQTFDGSGDPEDDGGTYLLAGEDQGDTCVTGMDDGCESFKVDCPVPFKENFFKKIYVCTNGLVCFNKKYTGYEPPLNNEEDNKFNSLHCLAPYHSDINFESSGKVCYQTYSNTAGGSDWENVNAVVTQLISDFYEIDIKPVYVIKVTWIDASHYDGSASERVTFQNIYVTDGFRAYTIYKYVQGSMTFDDKPVFIGLLYNGVATGLPDGGNPTFYTQADEAVTFGALQGVTSFDLTPSGAPQINPECECRTWHARESPFVVNYTNALNSMPACPCSLNQILIDQRFTNVTATERFQSFAVASSDSYFPAGKTCNYKDSNGAFIESGPMVGNFQKFNQQLPNNRTHLEQDVFYMNVCCYSANLCDLYREVRPPVDSCTAKMSFASGGGSGDPHITTIDKRAYPMNGHAEYILAKSVKNDLQIQARTERALTSEGALSEATIFSAFALQVTGAWVQAELNSDKTNIRLFTGTQPTEWGEITSSFLSDDFSYEAHGMRLKRDGDTLIISFIDAALFFNITASNGLLQMAIVLGNTYQSSLEGLLGNFNGDSTDDFVPRSSSTPIPDASSEREIFVQFAQTWITTPEESIFRYDNGKGHADYKNAEYVPQFYDEFTAEQIAAATVDCGEGKKECIFDLVATNNRDLALATNAVLEEAAKTEAVIANTIPTLSVISGTTKVGIENFLYTNIGEAKVITFRGEDDGTLTFELVETTAEASLGTPANDGTVTVSVVVRDQNPVSLSLIAKDNLDAVSPVVTIVFVLCTGCNSHGVCSTVLREDARSTDQFKYATCDCEQYWEGDDCEIDVDGCADGPCGFGRECTDTNADVHKATPSLKTYSCGPCPDGYSLIDDKCTDNNECATGSPCSQVCTNTEGSYTCQCNPGYRLAADGSTCNDINECEESSHNCEQICTNTPPGSFTCSCYPGYTYSSGTPQCNQDVTPPSGCDTIDCSSAAGCTLDESNSPVCFCNNGYQLVGSSCNNINECDSGVCSQSCNDNEGSYTCGCYTGFQLQDDKTTCSPCVFPKYGDNCASTCEVGRGFLRCNPVTGPVCSAGWGGQSCDIDLNECLDLNICGDVNKVCTNTVGSYTCLCRTGYRLDGNACVDIDECNDPDNPTLNTCQQQCQNSQGGFSCSCNSGFKVDPSDSTKCLDIDECAEGIAGCEQLCKNNAEQGGYSCECNPGYTINNDLKTCTLAEDPCADFPSISCSQVCSLIDGTPKCSCRIGFVLASDEQTCTDVNECDPALNLNRCGQTDSCVNVNGGYTCSCSPGFKLENDLRTCTMCDSNHYGVNCANECSCGAGASECNRETGCVCESGWTGDKCEIDRNECETSPCTGANEECINVPGSYSCNCLPGYGPDQSNVCQDIDECSTVNDCSQICTNTPGSYQCSCNPGFLLDGKACNDIDECAGQNDCTQSCENSVGSYRCTCNTGYKLDTTDRKTCIPEEECPNPNSCQANTECAMISGTETCSCLAGFQFVSGSSVECEDILECSRNPSPCSQACTEQPGGYQCSCDQAGYQLDADQITCVACPEGSYGAGCSQSCACDASNTLSCSNVDGACTCKDGWSGATCGNDVNECLDPAVHNCPQNSQCSNTQGSFLCQCEAGYIKSGDGTCQVCAQGTYGLNCEQSCSCITANTESCNNVNGACTCKSGWEGNDCGQNIDECTLNTYSCTENSVCSDTQGSYDCTCSVGFVKKSDGTCAVCDAGTYGMNCANLCTCIPSNTQSCNPLDGACTCKPGWESDDCSVNINECTTNTFTCQDHSTCQDTQGSYDCNCDSGYAAAADGTCTDIDECAGNTDDCLQTCENTEGSYTCSCDVGYQGTGNDCTICVDSYGEQCANPCNCDPVKSSECNHVTGCVCNSGYTGPNCTDIDECAADPNLCQANAFCTNIEGGHTCTCNTGYGEFQGSCQACSGNRFGDNCNNNCDCVVDNTVNPAQSCNNVNGTCFCNPFWTGTRCEVDIDECTLNTDNCTGDNEGCHNTENGFTCSCVVGYTRDSNNNCVQDTATTTTVAVPATSRAVFVLLTLNISLPVDLQTITTQEAVKNEAKNQLEIWYRRRLLNIQFTIFVRFARSGSLILGYDVVVPESNTQDVAAANVDLATNKEPLPIYDQTGYITNMTVGNTTVPVSNAYTDGLLCQLYEASINSCGQNSDCLVKDGKPYCQERDDDDFALKFGLGFGIPMFLLCVAVVAVIVVFMRQRRRRLHHTMRDDDDRSSSMFAKRVPVRIVTSAPAGPMYGPPDLEPYAESEYSDFDHYYDNGHNKREGQGSWNFVFSGLRPDEEYRIKRPNVDLPRGRLY